MNARALIVVFCAFQVTAGQEDPEKDLQDLLDQTAQEFGDHVLPLQARHQAFLDSVTEETMRLESERRSLTDELESLASELNTGDADVSLCLTTALDNVTKIVDYRVEDLAALTLIEFNNLNQVFNDIHLVVEEEIRLIRRTRMSLQDCKELANLEATNACINALIPIFNLMKDDIVDRLVGLRTLGEEVLGIAEENLKNLIEENQNYIEENAQVIRDEFTACVGNV